MAGLAPIDSDAVNSEIGGILRQFVTVKDTINRDRDWLAGVDLKVDPYNMTADDETLIKSAVTDLDNNLDAINMTFINRLVGLF